MKLYHGRSASSALSIMKFGFDLSKAGSNWGLTYGKGIYFTPNYETATFYAGEDGIVISVNLEITPYYLKKAVSATSKKRIKVPPEYNCIVSPDKDEYIVLHM